MLLERTRTIGLLKALGMNNGAVQQVFMYRSLFIAMVGVVIGDVVGVALCLAQRHLHLISLDSEGYFLDEVPIDLSLWDVLAVDCGVIVLLMLVLMLPTLIISKIKPEKTIRYQ
jgi:lipoprotein-releasing system permease protein